MIMQAKIAIIIIFFTILIVKKNNNYQRSQAIEWL